MELVWGQPGLYKAQIWRCLNVSHGHLHFDVTKPPWKGRKTQGLEQACGPGCEHAHSNRSWSTSPSGCCRPHLLFLQSRSGHCSSLRYGIGVHGVSMEGHRWEWDIGRLATYGLTWALPNLAQPLITFVSHPTSSRGRKAGRNLQGCLQECTNATVCLNHRVAVLCRQNQGALGLHEKTGKEHFSFTGEITKQHLGSTPHSMWLSHNTPSNAWFFLYFLSNQISL